ncbi:hypothetical protein SFC88_18760 [Nocardioides sp. HM23]|uniref:hypothetical protein n=1 Tax=Nocardioides bizhenqiangii TaxID=3095076 RepID=UPI002ACA9BC4|nr:hypothetical protein [Nocardioides sp. HM23]MDZ5622888.1 hypothetical protein [Nocardioides sp. HM23]
MTIDLRDLLEERIDAVPASVGDLDRVRSTGRRIRGRRRAALGAAAAALVLAGGTAVIAVDDRTSGGEDSAPDQTRYASLGALDFSEGARAFGDASHVYLGGRKVPAENLQWLDTDAAATSYGIVFYDRGRPMLLDPSGEFSALVDGPLDQAPRFHPTAKAEGAKPIVAWATLRDGQVTISVYDLVAGDVVASVEPDCGRCADLVIDGIDKGVVFVRTGGGTRTWDSATGKWADFAGPQTRVADVRDGVVLYDGPAPTDVGDWHLVAGAIDAQLTLDGDHVLYWSSTLEPTAPGGEPIVLERGAVDGQGYGQWTIDTDGSVLVITAGRGDDDVVYDCTVPSGVCEEILTFTATGGDPMFMGNDM